MLLLAGAASATTYYTYDNLGRVTQVVESNGTTTQYTYDADGNATSITRAAGSSALSIGSLSTNAGAAGSTLTINGSGFSSIPGQNTVTINGVSAQVTYASDNRLVVIIPTGATSGNIEITTQSGSIASSNAFTIVPVSISSFSPTSALPGSTVTINGGGFDPTPANNAVLINGLAATVSSATTGQLQITVPANATPGHISVTTPQGAALPSSADLFVPASGYSLSQIAPVAALVPGGSGHVYSLNAGQVSVALFDGAAGQRMSVIASDLSIHGQYTVYSPDGSKLVNAASISSINPPLANNLPSLPSTGTYTWYFTPAATPATATFKLLTDVTSGLPTDGTVTATSLAPGQSATYTFNGTAGQSYTLALPSFNGGSSVDASIYNPDGSLLVDCGSYSGYNAWLKYCDFTAGARGTHTARIVPDNSGLYPYSFNTFVVQDFSANLTAGTPGPAVPVGLVQNQHGLLHFVATANQTLALYFSAPALTPNNGPVQFSIKGPGNVGVTGGSTSNGQGRTFDLPNLAAGNYTVLTGAYDTAVAVSMQASLANGVTGTLPLDGTSAQFQTYVPGQSAYFTFAGTAGRSVGLGLTGLGLTPAAATNAGISVYNPDGSYYTSATCYPAATPGCQMSLRNLPQSGSYQVVVTPNGQSTMTLGMTMSQDQTGSLTLGTATSVNLAAVGQNGLFTFTLSGSQAIVLSGSSIVTTPANTPFTLYVYDASGRLVQYSSMTSSGVMNLGILAAGTYSVLVVPNNGATGSMSLTAQGAANAALPLDGSTTNLATLSPGQNAYVTFSATAGQSVGVAFSNLTFTPSSVTSATLTIVNPDGSTLWQSSCAAGTGCVPDYRGLPQTGTYTITIAPAGSATMSFAVAASVNFTQALTVGTPANITLSEPGQNAMLSFTASAGQSFALQIANMATNPANAPVYLAVYKNSGYSTVVSTTTTQAATTFNLSNLAAGTYVLWIGPQTPVTSSMQVTLQPPATTSLPTDGSSTSIATLSPGQNAYLTFQGTAGQSISAAVTGISINPSSNSSITVTLYDPNGNELSGESRTCTAGSSGCDVNWIYLPLTGTYHVTVVPSGAFTMNFTATVSTNVTGALTANTPMTVNLTSIGQSAALTFNATAGQNVTITVSGLSITPSGTTTWVGLNRADQSYVTGQSTTTSSATVAANNLAAGTYVVWISPETPATGTIQVSYH